MDLENRLPLHLKFSNKVITLTVQNSYMMLCHLIMYNLQGGHLNVQSVVRLLHKKLIFKGM
ncbi:hypothetical protein X975_17651, partial [Stegodyphus mimosarum]